MKLGKEVKCGRCDKTYSSLRSKCPYCGARKNRGGKRSAYSDNNKWQLIAGIIILVAIIVTVIVLIVTSLKGNKKDTKKPQTNKPAQTQVSEGVNTVEGTPAQSTTTKPEPKPTEPTVTVNSISLNREDFTLSKVGEQFQMKATVSPDDPNIKVTWKSNDEGVCLINNNGLVTAVNKGMTTIVATAGDKSVECIVRVSATAPAGWTPPANATGDGGTSGTTTGNTTGNSTSGTTSTGSATLSHTDVTINSATSETFTLKVNGSTETPKYSSGDTSVATVSDSGVVKAVSSGKTTVKVKVGDQTLECIVRVK